MINNFTDSNCCEKLNFYYNEKLSRNEMKNLKGGNYPSSCTASCEGADSVSLSCGANSSCLASDNVGVKCSGACTEQVCCYSGVPCVVE